MPHKSHAYLKSRKIVGGSLAVALLALSLQILSPSLLPSAQAGSTLLCSGFSDCASEGRTAHGYHAVWHKMFWRMFPYRNCVNYAAYRVIEDGGPATRPWSGSGNATNWGYAMSNITDERPTKGSIAWWKAYDSVGRYGHVAYVERVVSANEIIISESNYGSDFSWRRITKSGGGWPTGFIHFTDGSSATPIRNTVRPRLVGTAQVGETVRIKGGKWNPVSRPSYRWYADGELIPGARNRSLNVGPLQAGKQVQAKVVATKRGYRAGSVMTPPSATVRPGTLDYRQAPDISGYPEVGGTLRVKAGIFFPRGGERTFQWYADGAAIPGATGQDFTPTRAQLRKHLKVAQRVVVPGYKPMTRWSEPVGQVMAPEVALRRTGGVTGTPALGRTLTVDPGEAVNQQAWTQYQWRRDGANIPGATGRTYTLTKADLGSRITVQVRWKLKRFRNTDRVYAADGAAMATGTVRLQTKAPIKGRGVAIVRVTAPGTEPRGRVTVRIGRFEKTEWLLPGRYVWIGFDGMTPGKKGVQVIYHGSRAVSPDRATGTVRIRR